MRVTLVAPHLEGLPGQRTYVDALVRHLPADVRVVELRRPGWSRGAASRTLAAWASYPQVRRGQADVLHGTDTFCCVRGLDVLTVHDLIPLLTSHEPTALAHVRLFGRRIRAVPRVIVPTRVWADRVTARLGLDPGRVRVVPQGCDLAAAASPGPAPKGFRAGKRHVLVVGSYRPYKRIDAVIAALAAERDVAVVRIGPRDRGAEAQRCRALARSLGCDFQDLGPVPLRRVASFYAHADLLYYASAQEGFGLPPLEAMACGTSSLLSDIAVFREVYGDLAHYVGSLDDLRAALRHALEHPFPREALRAHAARFTWAETARKTFAVYAEALEERSGARRADVGATVRTLA